MKYILALITTLVLTACGGGGGGGSPAPAVPTANLVQPFPCASNVKVSPGRYRAAVFDTRRDEPSYIATGEQTTSFVATKRMIDRAHCAGFDTIIYDVNVPIDPATGLLVLDSATENYRLPKDFWEYVRYTKSLGMAVAVRPIPVRYYDDETIMARPGAPVVPVAPFFATFKSYVTEIASRAETEQVDFFFVGSAQSGLDTVAYDSEWTDLIQAIKRRYHGPLTYTTCDTCANVVWSKVDFVTVKISSVAAVLNIQSQYQRPVLIDEVMFDSITPNTYTSYIWQAVLGNQSLNYSPNYTLQQQKISDFFGLMQNDFANKNMGVVIGAYMPWLEDRWIQTPTQPLDQVFKLFDTLGYSLYNNVSAQTAIQYYLTKLW